MKKRTFLGGLLATTMLVATPVMAADWDGPTAGPSAAAGKSIVVVAGDLKNGGILGVTNGVEEAAAKIGWEVRVLDGAGSIQGRTAAIGQALALKAAALAEGYAIMTGCMMGSSLAMAPAVLVAQGVAITDLDGPLLLAEDRDTPLFYDEAGVHPPEAALWG